MASQPCAVVGIGQTKHKKRATTSRCRARARGRAARARRRRADVDRHRRGRARQGARPVRGRDDARAVAGRRARRGTASRSIRVHTAGSVGGVHRDRRDAPHRDRAPRPCAHGRVREAGRGQRPVGASPAAARAAWARAASSPRGCARTSTQSGAPEHIGWKVAVKDRQNALKNPYAHLQLQGHLDREGQGVPDAVGAAALPRVVPVVRRRVRDGAHERGRREEGAAAAGVGARPPRCAASSARSPGRDTVRPQAGVECAQTLLRRPRASRTRSSRSTCAELYVPFSWYEPMWLEGHDIAGPGEGWKMTDCGRHRDHAATSR